MKIERATRDEILHVARNMRQRDFDEIVALNFADTREGLAEALANKFADRDDILCASDRGVPICVGGFLECRPRTIMLLMFATDNFPYIGLGLTRFIRKQMFPRLIDAGVHRIEAISLAGYDEVHAWLRTLGLQPETGPLLNFGKNGEQFVQFSKVINVHAPDAG